MNFGSNWQRGMNYYIPREIDIKDIAGNFGIEQFADLLGPAQQAVSILPRAQEKKPEQKKEPDGYNQWVPLQILSNSARRANPGNIYAPPGNQVAFYLTHTPGAGLGK